MSAVTPSLGLALDQLDVPALLARFGVEPVLLPPVVKLPSTRRYAFCPSRSCRLQVYGPGELASRPRLWAEGRAWFCHACGELGGAGRLLELMLEPEVLPLEKGRRRQLGELAEELFGRLSPALAKELAWCWAREHLPLADPHQVAAVISEAAAREAGLNGS